MKKMILIAVLAVIAGSCEQLPAQTNAPSTKQVVLYYTCPMHPSVKSQEPGDCPICHMSLQAVYGNDEATNNASSSGTNNVTTSAKPKPYPLDTCLVDGMKLGSMGDPYVFVYRGQEIKLCCSACKPIFLKDPGKYIKKLKDFKAPAKK